MKQILIATLFVFTLSGCKDDTLNFLNNAKHPVVLVAKSDYKDAIVLMDAEGEYFSDKFSSENNCVSAAAISSSYEIGDTIIFFSKQEVKLSKTK